MPDSMIERIRVAMRDEVYRQSDVGNGLWVGGGLGEFAAGDRDVYCDGVIDLAALARVVLSAMREPTEAMRYAGIQENYRAERAGEPEPSSSGYRAMIDAALAEKP